MSVKYECDRCHRQYNDEKEMAEIHITQYCSGIKVENILHLCDFCRMITFNALDMAMSGKYGGSLNDTDMIGYFPNGKDTDPLFKEKIE